MVVRHVRVLPSRPRESVHASTLHRLSTQRRLCGIHRRRRFVLFSSSREGDDVHAAPLCAGLIGYRAYRLTGPALRLGIYGFGAAAHIIAQVARSQGRNVFAFVTLAIIRRWGLRAMLVSSWAGFSNQPPPRPLDAAIIFAPVGALVPEALSRVAPGGIVVCAGIHMSDIPSFPYRLLWQERIVRSVAKPYP